MRRIRPVEFEPPIEDGTYVSSSLRRIPTIRSAHTPTAYERIRKVRASILPRCVEIRNALNRVVLADGGHPDGKPEHLVLSRRLDALLSDTSSIEDKIDRARPALRLVFHNHAETIIYRLFEVGRLFRMIATRPLFFIASAPGTIGSEYERHELCIADEQFIWSIDDDQLHEWQILLSKCRSDLTRAAEVLLGAPEAEAMPAPPEGKRREPRQAVR